MNYHQYSIYIYIPKNGGKIGLPPSDPYFRIFPQQKPSSYWGIPNPLGLQAAKRSPSRSSTEVSTWPFLASWNQCDGGHVELGETRIPSGKGGILTNMDDL